MTRRRRRRARRLAGQQWPEMQGLPGGADHLPHYGQHPSGGVSMAGTSLAAGAQAQLEALLGVDSQLGLGNGVASDVGAGTWSSGRGLPTSGLTSSQAGMGMHLGSLSGGNAGRSGSATPSSLHAGGGSTHDLRGATPHAGQASGQLPHLTGGGGGSQHGSVASSLPSTVPGGAGGPLPGLAAGTAGITAASIGPNGVCLDYLAGRCPRGPACALSHALPSATFQQQQQAQQQEQQRAQLQHQQQLQAQQHYAQQQQQSFMQPHTQPQPVLPRGSTPQSPAAGATDGMLLLRGLEMTRATAEITRQELGAVVLGQARLLQEQAAGLAALEKQVAELQRTFTSALVTFEQRHWSALLGNEQRITNRVEQTVGQIVSAVGTKLDAIRQAQEDDSYIRRALSSNASTAHWPQAGAPQAGPRDGFANQSNDTVQPRTVTAALGRLNMGSGQVRLPPVSAPPANGQAAPNAQEAAKVASAASSEQEEVEALLREISASSAGGLELNNYGDANGRGGPGSLGSKSAVNGSSGQGASHSSNSSGKQDGANTGGKGSSGSSKDGIGNRPLKPLRGGSGGSKDRDRAADKVGRQDDDGSGGDGDGNVDEGRHGRSGDDDRQSVVGSTTGPSGGRRASNPNVPDEVVEEVRELQEEETGELLRVFEENQSNSGGSHAGCSGGSGGGGSHSGRPPPHRGSSISGAEQGSSAQRAASNASAASCGSDARSSEVRTRLQGAQADEANADVKS